MAADRSDRSWADRSAERSPHRCPGSSPRRCSRRCRGPARARWTRAPTARRGPSSSRAADRTGRPVLSAHRARPAHSDRRGLTLRRRARRPGRPHKRVRRPAADRPSRSRAGPGRLRGGLGPGRPGSGERRRVRARRPSASARNGPPFLPRLRTRAPMGSDSGGRARAHPCPAALGRLPADSTAWGPKRPRQRRCRRSSLSGVPPADRRSRIHRRPPAGAVPRG